MNRALIFLVAVLALVGCSRRDAGTDSAFSQNKAQSESRLYVANWDGEIGANTLRDFLA